MERQSEFLENRLTESEDKALILDKLIDMAEEEYLFKVRKNFSADQSNLSAKKTKSDKLSLWIGRDQPTVLLS